MSGTKAGGRAAAVTNKTLYGEDHYSRIGHIGGSKRVPKGFAMNRALARKVGAIGGRTPRRSKS